ncbi:MAG: bifunctional diaminohydroxyphosphoribosylaminopyrimidine deaminase/5-amino-6-(5-phosphoribosylamino)uracil reductase RibD [Pseudomonadota bacterium]
MLRTQQSSDDLVWMRRALDLGRAMRGRVWPNPPVGCVIVKDGRVVGEAATHAGGRPHAERKALDQAGPDAKGATLYVTLEPCCHFGRTPPCADAIIEAEVARVVASIQDPDPRVNGGGFHRLSAAGVVVDVGVLAEEAEDLMSGFFHRVRHGIPELFVTDDAPSAIPPGVDAMIVPSPTGPRVHARPGEIDIGGIAPDGILATLGDLGVTSVAVSRNDPLFRQIAGASTRAAPRMAPGASHQSPAGTPALQDP